MPQWAMVIDLDKCVACQGCSIACRFENNTPTVKPNEALKGRAIRWNDVFPLPTNPAEEEQGEYPNIKQRYLTRPCMHCQNPPCADLCPWGAARKLENGITVIHSDICLGGKKCRVVCPWDIPCA